MIKLENMNLPPAQFGNYFRLLRISRNFTLRGFCNRYGFDTAYISRIENNKIKPPSNEKLIILAEALGLQKGLKEWIKFFDLAYKAKNEIPLEIKQEVPELISLLPAFLRTPDGKKVSKEKIDKLINFLKNDSSSTVDDNDCLSKNS